MRFTHSPYWHTSVTLTLRKSSDPVLTVLQRQGPKLVIRNQLLYRVSKSSCGKERVQLVLPAKYHRTVLKSLHDDSGHLGVDRTTELIRDRFYWPRMTIEIEQYIKTCGSCITSVSLVPGCPREDRGPAWKSTKTTSCICNSNTQDATHRGVHTLDLRSRHLSPSPPHLEPTKNPCNVICTKSNHTCLISFEMSQRAW